MTDLPASLSEELRAARAFYLAMYEGDGGKWDAVEPRYQTSVWAKKAARFFELVRAAPEGEGDGSSSSSLPAHASDEAATEAQSPAGWGDIPSGKRFGRRLTADAVEHLLPGTMLRFHSENPWFEHGEGMPGYGEIVVFTGAVNLDFPKVGPHLEVARLSGGVYPGGGWVYHLFQFVSDPAESDASVAVAQQRAPAISSTDTALLPSQEEIVGRLKAIATTMDADDAYLVTQYDSKKLREAAALIAALTKRYAVQYKAASDAINIADDAEQRFLAAEAERDALKVENVRLQAAVANYQRLDDVWSAERDALKARVGELEKLSDYWKEWGHKRADELDRALSDNLPAYMRAGEAEARALALQGAVNEALAPIAAKVANNTFPVGDRVSVPVPWGWLRAAALLVGGMGDE
jgi:hypothetical protein